MRSAAGICDGCRTGVAASAVGAGMMPCMIKILAAALACAAVCAAGAARAQTSPQYDDVQLHTLQHGGDLRTYGLYVPPTYRSGEPAPLIIALHGRFSSAKAFHALSGLRAVADARGAILL